MRRLLLLIALLALPAGADTRDWPARFADREKLLADAHNPFSKRDWNRITFEFMDGDRAVQLSTRQPEETSGVKWVRTGAGTLKGTIVNVVGRSDVEIASHGAEVVGGVGGRVAVYEGGRELFVAELAKNDADELARDMVSSLWWRDLRVHGEVKRALGLDAPASRAAGPSLARNLPAPAVITIVPNVGEDLASLTVVREATVLPKNLEELHRGADCDPEMSMRDFSYAATGRAKMRNAVAALLEGCAAGGRADCSPNPAAPWPPTWTVREYADSQGGAPARTFEVPIDLVRCRALAAYEALGKRGDPQVRDAMADMAKLGLVEIFPSAPWQDTKVPQRLAPEAARERLTALAQGPATAPELAYLDVSLRTWEAGSRSPGGMRYAALANRPDLGQQNGMDGLRAVDTRTLQAILADALRQPSVVAGAGRSRGAHPSRTARAEFRVLRRYPGVNDAVPVYMAYLTRDEGRALAQRIARVVSRDRTAAN